MKEQPFFDIPGYDQWATILPINKGWSEDEKYHVKTHQGEEFLLRISDGSSYEKEKPYYSALQKLDFSGDRLTKLIASGLCNEEQNTYRIFSWIKGREASESLSLLSPKEQYDLGFHAGEILREIHQIPCPSDWISWAPYFNKKIDRNIHRYEASGIPFDNAELIISYLETNRHLLENRPQTFHHGDFHLGNMLINEERHLGIIDFNRLGFGDPWEEFNRIVWCATESKWFASGRINGYFEDNIPPDFFPLMAVYVASNQLASTAWAMSFGQDQIEIMLTQTQMVLDWYNNFQEEIPNWYMSEFKV